MTSPDNDELLIWSKSSIDAGEVPPDRGGGFSGLGSWFGLLGLLVLVIGGVWFIGRGGDEDAAPSQRVSGDPAPFANELRWSGPFQVEGASTINHLLVDRNLVYGIVDGWIATTTDMLAWEHLPTPDELELRSDGTGLVLDNTVQSPDVDEPSEGLVVDYDVFGDVVIVLLSPPPPPVEFGECSARSNSPALFLFVSFDGGSRWDEIELPGVLPRGDLFVTRGSGAVATDGLTAVATTAISRLPNPGCISEQFDVVADGAVASRATDQIVYSDAAGNRGSIDIAQLSAEDRAVLDEPDRIARQFVITPELQTAPGVGRPGPLLESTPDGYITGFGGIPAQLSTNHGQSFVELDRDRGLSVRRDIVLQPSGIGTRISADFAVTWTTPHIDFAATLDAVQWNDVLYILTTAIDPDGPVESGGVTLHSTRPGSDVTERLADFQLIGMTALTVYDDRLVVFGTTTDSEGSKRQIVYFGDRPIAAP